MSLRKADSPTVSNDPKDVNEDLEKESHLDTAALAIGSAVITDHPAERALCRKFDFRLLPVLAIMYLFNALDKGNLGNAKTDKMDVDLHFKNNQYNIMLSVFYVPYVLFALPLVSKLSCLLGQ
jgi:hypothetical protein